MRKLLLVLLSAFILATGFAQSLQLKFEDVVLEPGEEITITAHADSGLMSFEEIDVLNNSINQLNVMCAREVLEEIPNTENYFCWGMCYGTAVDTSLISVKVDGGGHTTEFIGDYKPLGNVGSTKVRYVFYDMANPDDQIDFIVEFKATTESSVSGTNREDLMSAIYPNPANDEANVDFNLESIPGKASFVVYNLLGSIIKKIEISEKSGSIKLNTSALNEGIYFYSLLINNESTITHKLIIKH